jgi:flagellar biosynthesis protein FlhG
MHSERITDQAEGLRRMLVRASARVVTVAAARSGLGATSVVVNLAAALAQAGKDVLVLDESSSQDNIANMLALKPRYDLLDAVQFGKSSREIMLTRQGVRILPVVRALQALPRLTAPQREKLLECLAEISHGVDVILVDAAANKQHAQDAAENGPAQRYAPGCARHIAACLSPEQPLVLVLNATAAAITESYALIKRMVMQDGRHNFEIVINRVSDERKAQIVCGNLAQVARRHLHVQIEYLGYIPIDESLRRATQLCRPVVEAFPAAPAARAFGDLGRNLIALPSVGNDTAPGLSDVVLRMMRQGATPIMAHAS